MNHRSDTGDVLRIWMADGPTTMPDRVVDVVAGRIARQPQRRVWRLRERPFMNTYVKLAAGLAAVIVVAVIGWQLLPDNGSFGGRPTPSPIPSASAPITTPAATVVPPPILEGALEGGTYRLRPFDGSMFIDATVPAGWNGVPSWAILAPVGSEAPAGLGMAFLRAEGLFGDPCHWDLDGSGVFSQPGDIVVGPTVDDLVTALQANRAYTSSTPTPVTIGGYAGRKLDIQLPSDFDFATCDIVTGTSDGVYFVFSGQESGLFAQGRGNRWQVNVLDVAGKRTILVVNDYAGTPPADRATAQAIVDSMKINP